jgi:hypothetical protein
MTDGVSWTEYEQHKREVKDNIVREILHDLDDLIDQCSNGGTSRDFIDGLQRARAIVAPKSHPLDQPRLF